MAKELLSEELNTEEILDLAEKVTSEWGGVQRSVEEYYCGEKGTYIHKKVHL